MKGSGKFTKIVFIIIKNTRLYIIIYYYYKIYIFVVEMIIDQVVWSIINNKHCSYRVKADSQNFCRNQYNLTGLCNRRSCPLANSQYATVRQQKGVCYLYMKTAERAHTPNKLWQKIKLDKNYQKSLEQIDENLIYWSQFIVHKCKQRLTKLRQMLIRMRKLKLQGQKQIVPIKKKAQRRDRIREQKALIAANIQQKIEQQLLQRLKTGVYQDIYNYNPNAFNKIIGKEDQEEQQQEEEIQQSEQYVGESDLEEPLVEMQENEF